MASRHDEIWRSLPGDFSAYEEERRRAFLLERVGAGDRVLDAGCGDGRFAAALVEAGAEVVGADVSEEALHRAAERAPGTELVRVEEGGPLPFADASFDVVWASEVLGHVADADAFLSELRRVLRPRGRLLITTPYHGRVIRARRLDPRGPHLRFYTRRALEDLLDDLGFAEIRVRAAGGVPLRREILLARATRPPLTAAR